MKVQYNSDANILMIQLSDKKVDDAYETESMIVHVSENNEPVLLEIFNGSEFLKQAAKKLPRKIKEEIIDYPVVAHDIKNN